MFNRLSLRVSLTLGIIVMGGLGILLALYIDVTYRDTTSQHQETAYSEILGLRINDILSELQANSVSLGQSVQNHVKFRRNLEKRQHSRVSEYLESHFHQYFVTAGILNLFNLIALDTQFTEIASARPSDGKENRDIGICPDLISTARERTGVDRLKIMSKICLSLGYPQLHMLIPIGGFKVKGYLEVVTDPVFSIKQIEKDMAMPLKLSLSNGNVIYQSEDWDTALPTGVVASYTLYSATNKPALLVSVLHDAQEYQKQLDRNRVSLMLTVVIVTFLCATLMMFFVKRSTLDPIRALATQLKSIQRNSTNLGSKIEVQGNKEVRDLAFGYNDMTNELKKLYDELHRSNLKLKMENKEKEKAQIQLKYHHDQLEDLVEKRTQDLAVARDEALQASRAKSRFLANMSHELRTPLNAIIGYSEIILEDAIEQDNADLERDLNRVYSAGKHLLAIINDVLDISKIEAGKVEVELLTFPISNLVDDVKHTVMPMMQKNANKFNINIQGNIGEMRTDPVKIRQALLNLLSNSAKFTNEGNVDLNIHADWSNGVERILFDVVDTGIGLSRSEIDHIFEAFNQADTSTTREFGGTGLGLSISRHYCYLLNGKLSVESTKGKGSKFTMTIPRYYDQTQVALDSNKNGSADGMLPSPAHIKTMASNASQAKVLMATEELHIGLPSKDYLQDKGYHVELVDNYGKLIVKAISYKPDIVILNCSLSHVLCWRVLKYMTTTAELCEFPTVLVGMDQALNKAVIIGEMKLFDGHLNEPMVKALVTTKESAKQAKSVLVIKDSMDYTTTVTERFQAAGYSVDSVHSSDEAILCMKRILPDVIIFTIDRDCVPNWKLLTEIKQNQEWRAIPIRFIASEEIGDSELSMFHEKSEIIFNSNGIDMESLPSALYHYINEIIINRYEINCDRRSA